VYQWCEFKSRRGKNKNLTAQKSNSNTVWFNFQTYIYIHVNTHTSLLLKCYVPLFMRKGWIATIDWLHGVGSNQFLSVNIGVIRLLSVITTTPFGNYGTSETMFDQKRWKKTKNIGKILPILSFTNSRILNWINFVTEFYSNPTIFFKIMKNLKSAFVVGANMWKNKPNVTDWVM
jgi:hypothetical protein